MKPAEFVKIARSAKSVTEIMERTKLTRPAVANRLKRLRKAGVLVPNFWHPTKFDVTELNKIYIDITDENY